MEKVKKKAYSCEIDILRGFATILVVLGHILRKCLKTRRSAK